MHAALGTAAAWTARGRGLPVARGPWTLPWLQTSVSLWLRTSGVTWPAQRQGAHLPAGGALAAGSAAEAQPACVRTMDDLTDSPGPTGAFAAAREAFKSRQRGRTGP